MSVEEATTSNHFVDLSRILLVMFVETQHKLTEQPNDHMSPWNRHSGR